MKYGFVCIDFIIKQLKLTVFVHENTYVCSLAYHKLSFLVSVCERPLRALKNLSAIQKSLRSSYKSQQASVIRFSSGVCGYEQFSTKYCQENSIARKFPPFYGFYWIQKVKILKFRFYQLQLKYLKKWNCSFLSTSKSCAFQLCWLSYNSNTSKAKSTLYL